MGRHLQSEHGPEAPLEGHRRSGAYDAPDVRSRLLRLSRSRRRRAKPGIGRNHLFATFLSSTWFMISDQPRDSALDIPAEPPGWSRGRCWSAHAVNASQRATTRGDIAVRWGGRHRRSMKAAGTATCGLSMAGALALGGALFVATVGVDARQARTGPLCRVVGTITGVGTPLPGASITARRGDVV